jgi:hypothetical protein
MERLPKYGSRPAEARQAFSQLAPMRVVDTPLGRVYVPDEDVLRPLGCTTGSRYADAVLYKERLDEWRWRTIVRLRERGDLQR